MFLPSVAGRVSPVGSPRRSEIFAESQKSPNPRTPAGFTPCSASRGTGHPLRAAGGTFPRVDTLPDLSPDMFSDALCYKLLSEADKLDEYTGVSEDLKNRIHSNVSDFSDFAGFCELLKTKNLTYARISRALIHILLNIKGDERSYKDILPEITHLRILGIKKDSAPLLKEINKRTEIKLISKVPDYLDEMNEITNKLFNDALFASTLYDKTVSTKYEVPFINEYSKKMPVV